MHDIFRRWTLKQSRRKVDNPARLLRLHHRHDGFGCVDCRADDAGKLGLEIVPGRRREVEIRRKRRGVVDENVNAPVMGERIGDQASVANGSVRSQPSARPPISEASVSAAFRLVW